MLTRYFARKKTQCEREWNEKVKKNGSKKQFIHTHWEMKWIKKGSRWEIREMAFFY